MSVPAPAPLAGTRDDPSAALPAAGQRWLAIAPHPDDETIPMGGLLQRARQAGAAVRVLLLTDGEANPWPQRWLERRVRIAAADRARWAARRRAECRAAIATLGLDPERDLAALAWPDGGLTDRLCESPEPTIAALHDALVAFAPTHVVLPAADDLHPDHNVVPVLYALALQGAGLGPATYAYRVHGTSRGTALQLALTPDEVRVKRAALACHRTQLALSADRFGAAATAIERFDADPFDAAAAAGLGWPGWIAALLRAPQGRWRWRTAGWDGGGRPVLRTIPAAGRRDSAPPDVGDDVLFAKFEPGRRGLWIYDSQGWRRSASATPRRP